MQNRSTDNLRFPASLGILFTLAATLVAAVVATAQACEEAAERLVVDAILDERPADANRWLTELDLERARIPSRAFYRALNSWWGASRSGDAKQAAAAVDQMAAAVEELSTRNRQRRTLDSLAAVGIARGHLARVMVASERYTEALATGTRAIDELETYLESAPPDHPARVDARLLTGLRDIYLANVPRELQWLIPASAGNGDLVAGENAAWVAITTSPVFAVEAARALVVEAPWHLPRACRKIVLARRLVETLPGNLEVSANFQALALKCGHAESALVENERARERFSADHPQYFLLEQGKFRALANLGETELLKKGLKAEGELDTLRRLALGNAHDVRGQRDRAINTYRAVLADPGASERSRQRAALRLLHPYSPPRFVALPPQPAVFFACQPPLPSADLRQPKALQGDEYATIYR